MITFSKLKSRFKQFFLLIFIIGLVFPGISQAQVNLSQLDSYFEKARKEWKIPGMAVAIVKDGKVVLAKGYGVKNFSKKDKVDEKTLFAIASNTKAFTAASLAILVQEGKIQWDDKVRQYLPYFKLYDPYVTEEMTVRDLLCHRSGLRTFSGDLLWYETSYNPVEVIKRARYLKPGFSFRSEYGYSNIMFMAAGEVVAKASGQSWENFVKEKIFKPLGMKSSNMGITELKKHTNIAEAHYVYLDGKTLSVPYTTSDNCGAAGSINSSVIEMAQWLKMLLNKGVFHNQRLLNEDSIWEMWASHNINRVHPSSKKLFPKTHFKSYGLGWGLMDYHGYKIISHGGGLDGMISRVALVPEINLGLVILTNSINNLPPALTYKIIDTYLGLESKDWSCIYLDQYRESVEKEMERGQAILKKQVSDTHIKVKLNDYTGRYKSPMYGDAKVSIQKGQLVLELLPAPVFISDLTHWHYDTFVLKFRNFFCFVPHGTGTVQFIRDKQGNVTEMKLDVPNRDLWFDEPEFKKK
ncbi:MAG: serine hydrolase [Candidatus Aminicenantaceae bacterium]